MWVLVVTGRLSLQCHFHSILYNKSLTFTQHHVLVKGPLLCLLSSSLCSRHSAIALLHFYHLSLLKQFNLLQPLGCLLQTYGLPFAAAAQA